MIVFSIKGYNFFVYKCHVINHKGNWLGTDFRYIWMNKEKFTRAGLEPVYKLLKTQHTEPICCFWISLFTWVETHHWYTVPLRWNITAARFLKMLIGHQCSHHCRHPAQNPNEQVSHKVTDHNGRAIPCLTARAREMWAEKSNAFLSSSDTLNKRSGRAGMTRLEVTCLDLFALAAFGEVLPN